MSKISHYADIHAYTTKDKSEIRELMHPNTHDVRQQSLAEATIKPGKKTLAHRHLKAEELYYILQGNGEMHLNNESILVKTGDSICIKPNTNHCIKNIGDTDLKILCCCSPAYSHDDTVLV